ncbi:MAG: DrmE family protein [Patescibacteria group bacterium]
MFNEKLLTIVKEKTADFGKINLSIGGYTFSRSDYDWVNTQILFNAIAEEGNNDLVVFSPHGFIFTLYSLLIMSFAELQRDLTSKENAIENNLKVGDRVKLDGNLGICEGKGRHGGREYFAIRCGGKYNDLIYVFIPDDLHRLYPYSGMAKVLRGHRRDKRYSRPRQAFSEILQLEISELNIIRTSKIAIISERKNLVDVLQTLKINHYAFTELFPTVKLVNPDKYIKIPGTRLSGEPVNFIVSNFNTLLEFTQKGNTISAVIIDGASKIRNNYGNINALKDCGGVEDILIFLDHRNLEEKARLNKMDFKTWVWTRKDIEEIKNIGNWKFPKEDTDDPFGGHYAVLKSIARQKVNLIDVRLAKTASSALFEESFNILRKVKEKTENQDNPQVKQFLINSYGLLLYFQHVLFPIDLSAELAKSQELSYPAPSVMLEKLKISADELLLKHLSSDFKKLFSPLLDNLEKLNSQFREDNFKAHKLIDIFKEYKTYKSAIIVRKPWQREIIVKWLGKNKIPLGENFGRVADILDFKSFQRLGGESYYYDRIIFSGWYGYEHRYIFNSGIANQIDFLLYPFERRQVEQFLKYIEKDSFNLRDIKSRAAILGLDVKEIPEIKEIPEKAAYEEYGDDIEKIISDISLSAFSDHKIYESNDGADITTARHVVFEEDAHAFFTESYDAKRLNRLEAKVEEKNIGELSVGDEIIFIGDSKRDIFAELIQIAEAAGSISEDVRLSKIWKEAIRKYLAVKSITYSAFAGELKRLGCERHWFTVENWITNPRIIAPEDENLTIKAIADVTGDRELSSKLQEVIHSCRKIRALHIRLGRYLAQCILASIDSQREGKIEGVMRERIKELSGHILIRQIRAIDENELSVSKDRVNRLIDTVE